MQILSFYSFGNRVFQLIRNFEWDLLIGYTMTLEIPVNVNTTLNQKWLPVIPGFTSLYMW